LWQISPSDTLCLWLFNEINFAELLLPQSCKQFGQSKASIKEPVMSEDIKQSVNTSSAEFKAGVKAGLDSAEDNKNWQAGNELCQELKDEGETEEPIDQNPINKSSVPLFMRDREGDRGNAQDEKAETEE
jgi:hypothetical protein